MGLNPVVWYSFRVGDLDICFFVPFRIATVLRIQHGVLALYVLPAVGFFFVFEQSAAMDIHAIGRFRRMPWASQGSCDPPTQPSSPWPLSCGGVGYFLSNDIFASFFLGLDFATGFPAVGGFADLSAHIRGSLFHRSLELPLIRARGVAYWGCAHIAILPSIGCSFPVSGGAAAAHRARIFSWYQTGHSAVAKM